MKVFSTGLLVAVSQATMISDLEYKFLQYVAKFGKSYASQSEFE